MPSHRGLQEEVGTLHRELEHTSGKLAEANVQLAAATRQKDHFSSELAARQQKLREVVRASCRRLLQAESFCLEAATPNNAAYRRSAVLCHANQPGATKR